MKYIIIIILIGIFEILLMEELHDLLGLKVMLLTYISTTIFGAMILYLDSSKVKKALKATKRTGRKLKKKTKKSGHIATQDELDKLKSTIYVSTYIAAVILIVLPGILTDILGVFIVLPYISKWYIKKEINKYIMKSEERNA